MSKKVITPVGTSLFLNYQDNKKDITSDYETIKYLPASEWDEYKDAECHEIKKRVQPWAERNLHNNASAEITSILNILREEQTDLVVYLLASETIVSRLAAKILKEVLGKHQDKHGKTVTIRFDPKQDVIKGLQVWNKGDFEHTGMIELVKRMNQITVSFCVTDSTLTQLRKKSVPTDILNVLEKIKGEEYNVEEDVLRKLQENIAPENVEQYRSLVIDKLAILSGKYEHTILNITGGFKATLPYLTIMGQIYNMPACYTFEETQHVIRIPKLPVQFDRDFAERYYPYLNGDLDITTYDKEREELENRLHLAFKDPESNEYKPTALGEMYIRFVETELPVAKTVLGYFVEYKLFEYYSKHVYQDYPIVDRGVKWLLAGNREIDLVLRKRPEEDSEFVVVESKPFLAFYIKKRFKGKTKGQIKKQIHGLQEAGNIPQEYHLCIYITQDYEKDSIRQKLIDIQALFTSDLPSCQFKVFFLSVDLSCDDPSKEEGFEYHNIYQKFLDKPIDKTIFTPYSL